MKALVNRHDPSMFLQVSIDLILLHLSMFFALAAAAVFHLEYDRGLDTTLLVQELRQYYAWFAFVISPLFLGLLWMGGIYSRKMRNCALRQRFRKLAGAILAAELTILAGNYLFLRGHIVARSVTVAFSVIVLLAFFLCRWLQESIATKYELVTRLPGVRRPIDAPILIVGGAGYIGSMLCRQLLDAGERVRVLDSLVYGDFAIAELRNHPRFELIEGDCRHIKSVVGAIRDVKSVVDLAAIVGDPACEQDRQSAIEINYAATRMLIEICKGHGVERFVFASSCSVYGATEELMDESSAVVPVSLYGQTKVDSERALLEARSSSFHPVILRLATVFGHGYRPRFDLLVNLLAARAIQDKVITIYNQQQWRPFIHVWDVARGFSAALNAPLSRVSGEVFNLGDNRLNYTLAGVAEEIRRDFPGVDVQTVVNSDRRTYRVNFDRIRSALGYQCSVSLHEGIAELKAALENGSIADYSDMRYNNQKFLAHSGSLSVSGEIDRSVMAAFVAGHPMAQLLRNAS